MTPGVIDDESVDQVLSGLITAFHILHQHQVLDEHGQISVRNPREPSTFFTSIVPAILISSKKDLNQWNVTDGSPVDDPYPDVEKVARVSPMTEIFVHSSMYNMYPGVQSVLHSHCPTAIVYGLCNSWTSMLQPSYLMAGFLGSSPPIFDTARYYDDLPASHPKNLLITTGYLGDEMAMALRKSHQREEGTDVLANGSTILPEQKAVFMRGHGYTTWAESLVDVVWRAIHIRRDAEIQTAAMAQRDATELEIVYLTEQEALDCERTINHADRSQWQAWVAQAERSGMYRNDEVRSQSSGS
ncbi:uncharacterized protein PV06_10186 [Exophiala oligosperma]|uniref:Class II aldolase/adducin N-terminal domain-containing protein n=2 Tax=Chaetothyriales TaxID=34395 RepID=A0A0D2BJH0_9EURO|nr:uncharacterized protein PV06_10186 [Exophiala oligosperma]KAJ9639834.1 hypothetical protein H2204_003627 [Knufia peltigerae]KIW37537.1 hypothetical protein PV06_10186 [Exophiala oligosperma]